MVEPPPGASDTRRAVQAQARVVVEDVPDDEAALERHALRLAQDDVVHLPPQGGERVVVVEARPHVGLPGGEGRHVDRLRVRPCHGDRLVEDVRPGHSAVDRDVHVGDLPEGGKAAVEVLIETDLDARERREVHARSHELRVLGDLALAMTVDQREGTDAAGQVSVEEPAWIRALVDRPSEAAAVVHHVPSGRKRPGVEALRESLRVERITGSVAGRRVDGELDDLDDPARRVSRGRLDQEAAHVRRVTRDDALRRERVRHAGHERDPVVAGDRIGEELRRCELGRARDPDPRVERPARARAVAHDAVQERRGEPAQATKSCVVVTPSESTTTPEAEPGIQPELDDRHVVGPDRQHELVVSGRRPSPCPRRPR